jgi:hypothetical protein
MATASVWFVGWFFHEVGDANSIKLGKDVEGLDHIRQCPWRDTGKDPAVG